VLTGTGKMALAVPRDRLASFEPQLIAKDQRRFPVFDEKIISRYARGISTREIQGDLRALYGLDVSPELVCAVTDPVLEAVTEWQNRPLEALYPLMFFDAIGIKVRDEGTARNKAVYVALGVRPDGTKEVLGLWIEQSEGAKFWLRVMNELKSRGVDDVLIAIVDGLKGFPDAITALFPQAQVQTCVVHLIRYSLALVSIGVQMLTTPQVEEVAACPGSAQEGPARRVARVKALAERRAGGACVPTWASGGSAAVLEAPAVVAGLDDVAVMGEPVEQGGGHLGVAEDARPVGEGEVGGDDDRGSLVKPADQVEQELTAALRERQVAEFIEHHQDDTGKLVGQGAGLAGMALRLEPVGQVDGGEELRWTPNLGPGA
jgi:putative transposase